MKLDTERERVGHHNWKWLLLVTHFLFFIGPESDHWLCLSVTN